MNKPVTVEKALDELEAWRPALIAFWKRDCAFQRAENLGRGEPMDALDQRTIAGIRDAIGLAPKRKLKIAA